MNQTNADEAYPRPAYAWYVVAVIFLAGAAALHCPASAKSSRGRPCS
jgi:hypothetical protein